MSAGKRRLAAAEPHPREEIDADQLLWHHALVTGPPIRIGIGEKSLAKGEVELKPRGGSLLLAKAADAVSQIKALLPTLP